MFPELEFIMLIFWPRFTVLTLVLSIVLISWKVHVVNVIIKFETNHDDPVEVFVTRNRKYYYVTCKYMLYVWCMYVYACMHTLPVTTTFCIHFHFMYWQTFYLLLIVYFQNSPHYDRKLSIIHSHCNDGISMCT